MVTIWMYRMALAWIVWDMTHSATWLGIFGFLDHAPSLLVSPLAGALSDRVDRMKFLRVTQALLVVHALLLSGLLAVDLAPIEVLAVLTLLFGVITNAQMPPSQSIIPNLVTKDLLTSAYGLNSMIFNMSRFIGPMAAGIVIGLWTPGLAIFFNAIGTIIFMLCLAFIRVDIKEGTKSHGTNLLTDMREGLRYASRHPGIGPILVVLTMAAVLTFPILQLLPSFADGIYGAGPQGLSWMISTLAVGAMLQGGYLAMRASIAGLTSYVFLSMVLIALGFFMLAATDILWFGLLSVFVIGFTMSSIKMGAFTLVQYAVDGDMRGRVASFIGVIYHAGPAVGSVLLGALGDLIGIRPTIAIAGGAMLAVWAWSVSRRQAIGAALEAMLPDDGAATAGPSDKKRSGSPAG